MTGWELGRETPLPAGCRMKFLKDMDFMAQTSTPQETLALLLELKEYLVMAKHTDGPSQASRQTTACDRILRACIHRLGEGLDCPAYFENLQALAEVAYHGYVTARLHCIPLYLERLLFHLLKGIAARGPSDACMKFADLLYADLLKCQPPQVSADDRVSIAKSAFSILWKCTDAMAKMDKTPAGFRTVLSTQLQAARFLFLLEHDGTGLMLPEPPFFTSMVARHTSTAAVIFEAQRSPLSGEEARFLSEQICHVVAALLERTGMNEPLAFQDSLCVFELTVVRVRYLCKSGCFRESKEVLQQSSGYLRKLRNKRDCFSVALDLLTAGVELNRVFGLASGSAGPFFTQAAEALNTSLDAQEPLLRVLAETCQLFITPLYEHARKSKLKVFGLQDILGLSAFMEGYFRLLSKLLDTVALDNTKQQQALKKLLCNFFQLYTTVICDSLQALQGPDFAGLSQLLVSLQRAVTWMLDLLEGLPEREKAEYLDVSAYCVSRLAYSFYCQKMYVESNSIAELFSRRLVEEELFKYPELPTEKLHNCFKLQVENCRKLGRLEEALKTVVFWLVAQRSDIVEQMTEPVSSWVKIKMDAHKNGADDLRLKTLKEGLGSYSLAPEILMKLLLEELKAYKAMRVDTGQERFNVICDLLEICSEGSSWTHERAVVLIELAQVLCYHDYNEQTECSALDSIHEALRLLDSVPKTSRNEEQLQDDKAQALLWLYICTIEDKMHESIQQEQRIQNIHARGQKTVEALEGFETNDLGYEEKSQDDKFLYLGIAFNLSADSVQSKCLDDALALWKQLLSKSGIPAVRSIEQTKASLNIIAALYRMMGKPLQAIESYFLITTLSGALEDSIGMINALCQIARLLLLLQCPSYAENTLKEAESCLQNIDGSNDSCLLMNQMLNVLRSKLCLANHQVEEGLDLLLKVLQNPALQKPSKAWYLLRANALQLTAAYLGLPPSSLPLALRQKLRAQGWKTPEMALSDAHKLYRSILLNFLLISSGTSAKDVPEHHFVDHGDNLVQKWQVLADMFVCSEKFVSLLGKIETVSEAKAFCLEALKISMKLQSIRWCARFLVLKSELELKRSDLELCHSDLEQVLFLLESGTVFETKGETNNVKIKPKKGGSRPKKPPGLCLEPFEEEQTFLREVSFEFVDTVSAQKEAPLTTSPVLKPKLKKQPIFLTHPEACHCSLCSDVALSVVCLCWLVVSAEGELAHGNRLEGLRLLEAGLKQCATVSLRISNMLACISQGNGKKAGVQHQPTVGLLDDLVADIYVALAKQSMSTSQPEKKLWKLLEAGLTLLCSKGPQLPGFKYQRASLLLTKAVAAISVLASHHGGCTSSIFSRAWSWKLPLSLHGNPENQPAAEKTLGALPTQTLKSKTLRQPVAAQKAKPKRIQGAKSLLAVNPSDPFALVDSDSEAPPVVRLPIEHCTPAQKPRQTAKTSRSSAAKPTLTLKAPFVVFEESSPRLKVELPKAPKVSKRMKSRLKAHFSDDSDPEDLPETAQDPKFPVAKELVAATCRPGQRPASSRKQSKMSLAKMEGCSTSSSCDCSQTAKTKPQHGRPCGKRATRRGKQQDDSQEPPCEERTLKAKNAQEEEEKEVLRTIKEGLEASFEVLRGSEEEAMAVKGNRKRPTPRSKGTEEDQEVLRRDIGSDLRETFLTAENRGSKDPFDLHALASSLDTDSTTLSMDSVYNLLQAAFYLISHYPSGALYRHICHLMALCIGNRDPLATAYLVSESVSVTLRHQMMSTMHKRLNKMKKASVANAAKQLEALNLQEGNAGSLLQHLSELEKLFEFSCPSTTELETRNFREQLQQIPCGVTVCVLTLVSIQPGAVGDTLLLTRLEKDATPVTILIQTICSKVPLSAVLGELAAILQKQKEISNLTEKEDWWLGRIALDKRMKALTESLETDVLGCWRGALLPAYEDRSLAQEASHLQTCLRECGCERVELALLKAMLTGSHLLTQQDVQCLAWGLNLAEPKRAQHLLQEAVDKLGSHTGQASRGHLVLVLDKGLLLTWQANGKGKTTISSPVERMLSSCPFSAAFGLASFTSLKVA
ncbi:separin isoform X2 [Hemicordylus capensis]|uniref:separin isoform X2 n=1 Tax=Hemicordylus capensis TaxID=884348 RepID=UPI0023021E62|nr:separin isoform X2 [Hemicordylus capensis]